MEGTVPYKYNLNPGTGTRVRRVILYANDPLIYLAWRGLKIQLYHCVVPHEKQHLGGATGKRNFVETSFEGYCTITSV